MLILSLTVLTLAGAPVAPRVGTPVVGLERANFGSAVSDAELARSVGRYAPRADLRTVGTDNAAQLAQLNSANLRVGFDNWFADGNITLLANTRF